MCVWGGGVCVCSIILFTIMTISMISLLQFTLCTCTTVQAVACFLLSEYSPRWLWLNHAAVEQP